MTHGPLTDRESAAFDSLAELLHGHFLPATQPALVRAQLHGRDVAVVVALTELPDGGFRGDPVAVLIDEHLVEQLDPGEDVTVHAG